ncbi:c-type cytochrome [Caldimonas brevitalea]|uniref:Cytochrome C n=1 Tax=Caldimonas brevitalea TaxID=413882 RepID=A0A0G3BS94_9BURK|nr:c-type cytochrome [Caldimonas brevitalea]AKJ30873.1 cytochrome C [Caldimonas brevitalea]
MDRHARVFSWSNRGFRWSVVSLVLLTVVSLLVGFVWLPSVHPDFTAQGLWAAICRAAGVPSRWYEDTSAQQPAVASHVVLERNMARVTDAGSVGRGATLALNCTMCHGAQGMSTSNAPNLAGQYPEVIIKQLMDYQSGKRVHALMQGLAAPLSEENIRDLAAYYASLPKARTAPTFYDESLPALVRVGAPLRNIAPCISCHGGVDQKFGAPWIEGMPKDYLVGQLHAFRTGARGNDVQGQMRAVARTMTDQEIQEVSEFYARKAAAAGVQGH